MQVYIVANTGIYPEQRDHGAGFPEFFDIESVWDDREEAERDAAERRDEVLNDDREVEPRPEHLNADDFEEVYGYTFKVFAYEVRRKENA